MEPKVSKRSVGMSVISLMSAGTTISRSSWWPPVPMYPMTGPVAGNGSLNCEVSTDG